MSKGIYKVSSTTVSESKCCHRHHSSKREMSDLGFDLVRFAVVADETLVNPEVLYFHSAL